MNPYDLIYDLNDEVNKLTQQLALTKASLSRWESVFGHLGTPDEVGNEWHALIERADRLEKVESALSDLLTDLEERAKWNLEASQRVVACGNGVYVRAKAALEKSK